MSRFGWFEGDDTCTVLFHSGSVRWSNSNNGYVLHSLSMPYSNPAISVEFCSSSETNLLDHLDADGAGFTGGQAAVIAVDQADANFLG